MPGTIEPRISAPVLADEPKADRSELAPETMLPMPNNPIEPGVVVGAVDAAFAETGEDGACPDDPPPNKNPMYSGSSPLAVMNARNITTKAPKVTAD